MRTQFMAVEERSPAADKLMSGTPGQLGHHEAQGRSNWYRRYYPVAGAKPTDDCVCKDDDRAVHQAARDAIAFSDWMAHQVRALRKLDFQLADKDAAGVLVELHNCRLFAGTVTGTGTGCEAGDGLVVVGTLAFMGWLVEQDDARLGDALKAALKDASADLVRAARARLPALRELLGLHPQTLASFGDALGA